MEAPNSKFLTVYHISKCARRLPLVKNKPCRSCTLAHQCQNANLFALIITQRGCGMGKGVQTLSLARKAHYFRNQTPDRPQTSLQLKFVLCGPVEKRSICPNLIVAIWLSSKIQFFSIAEFANQDYFAKKNCQLHSNFWGKALISFLL